MLLNPLPLQEAGTEASFGFTEAVTSKSTGPPFREILFKVQQHLNGPPNRSGPVPAEPETEPTYPSLATLIAEILAEKAPRPSSEKITGGVEVSVAQLQDEGFENSTLTVPSELPSTEPAATGQAFLSEKPVAPMPQETDAAESFPEGKIQPESDAALSTSNAKTFSEALPVQENELPTNTATAEESQNNPADETSVPLAEAEPQPSEPQVQPRTSGVISTPPQNSSADENEVQNAETEFQTRQNVQSQPAHNNQQGAPAGSAGVTYPQNAAADENESRNTETELQTRENVQSQPAHNNQQVTLAGTAGVASAPPQNVAPEENQTRSTENQRRENVQSQPAHNNQQVTLAGTAGVETPLQNTATTGVNPASKQDIPDAGNQPPVSPPGTETVSATAAKQQPVIAPPPGETQPSSRGTQQEPVHQPNGSTTGVNIPSAPATASASPRETVPANMAPASQTPESSDPVLGTVLQSAGANIPQPTAPRRNPPTQELPEDIELQVRETAVGQEPVRRASLSREQAETQPDPESQETPVAFRAEPIPHRSESSQVQTAQPDMSASVRPAQGSTIINSNTAPRTGVTDQPQDPHQVSDQIVRGARMLSRNGTTEVTVRLDPPELGSVTIRLQTQNNSLSGEITVENRQVHDVVRGRLADLREALSNQGIQVDRIEVSVDGRGASGPDRDASNSFFRENSQRSTPQDNPERQRRSPQWENQQRQRSAPQEGHVDFTA
ncbi:MAG: flagellar hook-length control protein FliK [bacterium]|nr:flagellar hook-length control protein FliK [bacterium]